MHVESNHHSKYPRQNTEYGNDNNTGATPDGCDCLLIQYCTLLFQNPGKNTARKIESEIILSVNHILHFRLLVV